MTASSIGIVHERLFCMALILLREPQISVFFSEGLRSDSKPDHPVSETEASASPNSPVICPRGLQSHRQLKAQQPRLLPFEMCKSLSTEHRNTVQGHVLRSIMQLRCSARKISLTRTWVRSIGPVTQKSWADPRRATLQNDPRPSFCCPIQGST